MPSAPDGGEKRFRNGGGPGAAIGPPATMLSVEMNPPGMERSFRSVAHGRVAG